MEKQLGRIYSDVAKTWYRAPGHGTTSREEDGHVYTRQDAEKLLKMSPPLPKWNYRFVPLSETGNKPEAVGHIFNASEGLWFRAPGQGTTNRIEEAHRYTASEAEKTLENDLDADKYAFFPLPGQLSRADSSQPVKPTAKQTLPKLYSFRGEPNVKKLWAENPKAKHLLLEINEPGKTPYWKILSRKFDSQRILDNREQAEKTFAMLNEPEPTPKSPQKVFCQRWVLTWDGHRTLSETAIEGKRFTKPGDPFAVVLVVGKKAWYYLGGAYRAENDTAVLPEEAWARVEEARLKARGPRVKVFGTEE